jgi:hypothetical protein
MKTNNAIQRILRYSLFIRAFLIFCLLLNINPDNPAAAEIDPFLRRSIKAHDGEVTGVDLSPDAKLIVSGGSDGRIGIWNVADGSKLHTLGEYQEVTAVAFSPNEAKVAAAAINQMRKDVLQVWDYEKAKAGAEIKGHSQRINIVAFSPNGKTIASGSNDNTLRMWYAGNGRDIQTYEDAKSDFLALGWSPDNNHLAGGLSWAGDILVWNTSWDKVEQSLAGHNDWVKAVLYSPDGRNIISGSRDGSVRFWDAKSGKEKYLIKESWWGEINDLAISGDGAYLAGATEHAGIVIWHVDSGKTLAVLTGHSGRVTGVAFSADGKTIISGGADGTVRIWTTPESSTPETLFDLAGKHNQGSDRIKEDKGEAFKWYLKAAEGGYTPAMTQVGLMFVQGEGTAADLPAAVKWLTAAADQNDPEAMYSLANMYAAGQGVIADQDKAAGLWVKAADKGHAQAGRKLGKKVAALDIKDVDKNSLAWLQKAAESGDVKAMFDLALVYKNGAPDVAKNIGMSAKWFMEAAILGHADAQYNLGKSFATGSGVKQSGKEAINWYGKASAQGHVEALYQLGLSYAEGKGVKKDDRKAADLLKKAAGKGNLAAKYRLGILYCTGKGVSRDYARAVKLWQETAGKGDVMSMFFLGYMYETGSGVKRNPDLARKYYKDAAGQGNIFADQAAGMLK